MKDKPFFKNYVRINYWVRSDPVGWWTDVMFFTEFELTAENAFEEAMKHTNFAKGADPSLEKFESYNIERD